MLKLPPAQQRELLALARASIETGLTHNAFTEPSFRAVSPGLMQPRSCFVTLHVAGALRGCCGTLDSPRPLAHDVWRNAWACGFEDARFPPLTAGEWPLGRLHISALTPPKPLGVMNERELIETLRPRVDGLILELGATRATFLPTVWTQLSDPALFVRRLKIKAGWAPDGWSPQMHASVYQTDSFGEDEDATHSPLEDAAL